MLREAVSLLTPTRSRETFALSMRESSYLFPKAPEVPASGAFAFSGATRLVISVVNRSPAQYRVDH